METSRFSELRTLGLNRNQIALTAHDRNAWILTQVDHDVIREVLVSEIRKLSIDEIKNHIDILDRVFGITVNQTAPLDTQLYSLLVEHVLLPENLSGASNEKVKTEVKAIVERIFTRINRLLKNEKPGVFSLHLGNERAFQEEMDNMDGIAYHDFWVGGNFGQVIFCRDEKTDRFIAEVPVRISKQEQKAATKFLDPEKVKNAVYRHFARNKKSENPNKAFKNLVAKVETKVDKDASYGRDQDSTYVVISLSHKKLMTFSGDEATSDEIRTGLQEYVDAVNVLVNDITKETGAQQKMRRYSFFVDTPYYEGDEVDDGLSGHIDQKFSKLVVRMREPVKLKDIGGQKHAKEEVADIIMALQHPEIMQAHSTTPPTGIIFHGPAGTGKTLLAMAIATEVNAEVYNIKLTDIANSPYINEGAKNAKELFDFLRHKAKKSDKRIIVILDELDALFKKRGGNNQSQEDTKIVNTFLAEMSGFDDMKNVIFVGTTNHYADLDPAMIRSGRFGTKVRVELPDVEGREEALRIHIGKHKSTAQRQTFGDDLDIRAIAEKCEWVTGADIREAVRRASSKKAYEEIKTGKTPDPITQEEFLTIVMGLKEANGNKNKALPLLTKENLRDIMTGTDTEKIYFLTEALRLAYAQRLGEEIIEATKTGAISPADLEEIIKIPLKKHGMGFLNHGVD